MSKATFNTNKPGDRLTRQAFSLVELLVAIGIMAVIVSLAIPTLGQMRARSRELVCLTHVSQLQAIVASYSIDARGFVPARYSDRREFLKTEDDRFRYGRYPYRAFYEGPVPTFSGLLAGSRSLACPSNQFVPDGSTSRWTVDYSISSAAYLDSRYLSPDLPSDQVPLLNARVAVLDEALFPSAKAGVYEAQVWHAWPFFFSPESPQSVNGLFHWGSGGRISIAFLDGHAEPLFRDEIASSVVRAEEVLSSILNTTPYGMRGRDLK